MIIRTKYTNEEREIVKELRPIDDTLFRIMAKGNIILVEHIVRLSLIILSAALLLNIAILKGILTKTVVKTLSLSFDKIGK